MLRIIREILYYKPEGKGTDIGGALDHINSAINRKSVVFLISDFMDGDYNKKIGVTGRRHDLIALRITDQRELRLSDIGLLTVRDAETDRILEIDTSNPRVRKQFEVNIAQIRGETTETFKKKDIDYIDLYTGQDYAGPLVKFFRERAKRVSRGR